MSDRDEFIGWIVEKYPELPAEACARLLEYADLLAEAAGRLNLISRGDLARFHTRHLAECLAPELSRSIPPGSRVLDVGSGGGLPGIPLAILRPDLGITLLEAKDRKAAFLDRAIIVLKLVNSNVRHLSLETLAPVGPPWRFAIARGVAWSPVMVESLERCLEPQGELIRFGAPAPLPGGVRGVQLQSETPRALQFWPRDTWTGLPEAP